MPYDICLKNILFRVRENDLHSVQAILGYCNEIASVGWVLNCQVHDIPALIHARLLKPLGNFSQNSTKYFATADVLEMTKDRGWPVKVSDTICQHWQKQNAKKRLPVNGSQNGHSSPLELAAAANG